ncbi:ABC transporter permease subunit [Glaciimonas immobilis]|uniref:Dipeptide transport system permease protein n=1 Tax=Glaciimonas immobilis TaxID=728004 RepID=A0A840RK88_9BURK|nr:ABC transporter permease subunit [Glaciimonas immobilis]KAF3999168.1 ABC transporter permease subunit [Glaciimonas immobilis]MBB5198617.1 dipeptide transport system permease protein [Glaciimonas immobilis]
MNTTTSLQVETPGDVADIAEIAVTAPPHGLKEFWGYFSQNRGAVMGLIIVFIIVLAALFADVIAPHSPIEQFREATLVPPVWQTGGSARFLLGTDPVGRDMLSRLIHGARLSLIIGLVSVSLSLILGIVLGLMAGYFRGLIEVAIMRLMDIMLALPSLLLAVAVVAILGPGLINAMYAIAIVMLPHYARQTRAAVIGELAKDYVSASRIAGAGTTRIMFNCVLPNCAAPLIVQATLGFSTAILDAAALGFLGLGAQPPTPEWGSMLASALEFIQSAWWVVTFPGLAILVSVLAFNLMGDGLRDALDPKLKR